MVNQFEHLADLYIADSDLDLGERELDLALSLDHDIDFFASAIAWTKTSLLEIFKDDGELSNCLQQRVMRLICHRH
jgi:dynactin 1